MSTNETLPDEGTERVAVTGMACRFPGAGDVDSFWRNLTSGIDSVTRGQPRPVPGGSGTYTPARGLLASPEWFDADYFGYLPVQARIIAPQQRVFLECGVEALEHAGVDAERFTGGIGVYAGGTETGYAQVVKAARDTLPPVSDWEILIANGTDFLASRLAYKLGLRGPAITVQAACATALVAVHMAVQALLSGDCDLALAGGAAVHVPAKESPYTEGGILSRDGYCRAFDAKAGGTVGADGVGIVVLKRLTDALADGDHVHAVLRGTAVNNDGADRIGYTAPSIAGQAAVIRDAQLIAGVDAATIGYVEAHGTATPLGDPIEVAALTQAFRAGAGRTEPCRIGSVKANIGHADAAAGAAGLIKAVLAVEHGVIPPSLHYEEPNPRIDFAASPFRVVTELEEWRAADGAPRRAGVSSFGIGGTNAHVIVEQPPPPGRSGSARPWQLLPLSARTPQALAEATARLAGHLRANPGLAIADVAWTLQAGRREHPCRRYAIVSGTGDAAAVLTGPRHERLVDAAMTPAAGPVAFQFGEATADRCEIGELLRLEPAFQKAVEECQTGLPAQRRAAVRAALRRAEPPSQPLVADLLTFTEQYALARLWMSWGVRPDAVYGTGTGALVAAAVTGNVQVSDAISMLDRAGVVAAGQPARPRIAEAIAGIGSRAEPGQLVVRIGASLASQVAPSSRPSLLPMLGDLWLAGVPVDWAGVHAGERRGPVPLPTYPFQRQRHVVEPAPAPAVAAAPPEPGPQAPDVAATLTGLIAETLGLPGTGPADDFFDLGGDSVLATHLLSEVNRRYGVDIDVLSLYDAPTAAGLAELIASEQAREAA